MTLNRFLAAPILLLGCFTLACRDDGGRVTAPAATTVEPGAVRADNVASLGATQRPIEDFVNAQTNFFAWSVVEQKTGARGDNLFMLMDYAGLRAQQIIAGGGPDLGTTFSGTVTERPLADGTAEVHVVLHTHNAFALGRDLLTGTLLFGHAAAQVIAGADVAIGDCDLEVTFINSAPGAPLPSLTALASFESLFFRGSATGTLRAAFGVPDGTPGRGHVVQNGLFQASGRGATADGFPAELITFKVVGGGN